MLDAECQRHLGRLRASPLIPTRADMTVLGKHHRILARTLSAVVSAGRKPRRSLFHISVVQRKRAS